ISLDNDGRKTYEALLSTMFTNHAYGTQTTIGTVEHLKNPSLVKIRNYYNTYYVPNNMAIIMSGDFNPDRVIEMIAQKFAYMKSKPVPEYTFKAEPVHTTPLVTNVYGPDAESVMVGFRFPGAPSKESKYLAVCDYMLSNSKAGLMDLNLVKKQKVLSAGSDEWTNKDYNIHMLSGKPKDKQSLEEVRDLLLEQIELIKKGDFDEEMLKAIINNFRVEQIKNNETNRGRTNTILESFTSEVPWNEMAGMLDEMATITKQEIVDFANKYYTNDYVVIYKRQGENKVKKIVKPEIHPVKVNREDMSPFAKSIAEMKAMSMTPMFIDFDKDIQKNKLGGKLPVYYVQNTENGLFKLYYVFDMGKLHDLKLPIAINLLQYLGTDKYTAEQISKEFFKLACDFGVSSSDDQVYVHLSGLDENFAPAVRLFEHLLSNIKPDQQALNDLVERTLKTRTDAKLSKGTIFRNALRNYAMFGKSNPFTYNLTAEELKKLKAEELTDVIKELSSYQHKVFYYGPHRLQEVNAVLNREHKIGSMKGYPKRKEFKRNEMVTPSVYFTDYKMVQSEIMWLNKQQMKYDTTLFPVISMFNEYFGGGMSSLVFQTIRESKALAYSTYSYFQTPGRKPDPYYIIAYIGTQADKMNDAIPAMNELIQNMPKSDNAFEAAKQALKNKL
ncbi:MAG: M16 family metallopeptidase, partial [Bacteroidia bacterium]